MRAHSCHESFDSLKLVSTLPRTLRTHALRKKKRNKKSYEDILIGEFSFNRLWCARWTRVTREFFYFVGDSYSLDCVHSIFSNSRDFSIALVFANANYHSYELTLLSQSWRKRERDRETERVRKRAGAQPRFTKGSSWVSQRYGIRLARVKPRCVEWEGKREREKESRSFECSSVLLARMCVNVCASVLSIRHWWNRRKILSN